MKEIKTISIIVPVFNVEKYLCKCVDSILNQTFTDFECILVDDGSLDNCPKICDEYAQKDKRVRVIHKKNGGLSDARNAGLDIAQGDYVSFIDGDDFISPQTYELMLDVMSKADAEIGCFNYQFIKPEEMADFNKYNIDDIKSTVISSQDFLSNFDRYYHAVSWISACTKIYKREIFQNCRFPYGKVDEDSYMLHKVVAESNRVVRVEEKLYYYVWTPNSISRSDFSVNRFDKNGANLDRIDFFEKLGIKNQERFFKRLYLLNVLKMYYLVKNEHPEFLADYKKYIFEYRRFVWRFMKNNDRICKIEKIIYIVFAISPKMAEKLYDKFLK